MSRTRDTRHGGGWISFCGPACSIHVYVVLCSVLRVMSSVHAAAITLRPGGGICVVRDFLVDSWNKLCAQLFSMVETLHVRMYVERTEKGSTLLVGSGFCLFLGVGWVYLRNVVALFRVCVR